jgi:hypothetical protein
MSAVEIASLRDLEQSLSTVAGRGSSEEAGMGLARDGDSPRPVSPQFEFCPLRFRVL